MATLRLAGRPHASNLPNFGVVLSFEISSHSHALLSQEGSAIEDGARGGSEGKHAKVLLGNPLSRDFDYAAQPLRLIALSP
jgi:hypothetical protein